MIDGGAVVNGNQQSFSSRRKGTFGSDATRHGMVLITSLLIMVLVLGLGISSLFLTNMNVRTTENIRSQSIARNAAETGMDVARLALQAAYREAGAFPENFALPVVGDLAYGIVADSYSTSGSRVRLAVQGSTPTGAVYTLSAEMLAQFPEGTGGEGTPGDGFPGLLSETTIELSGAASGSVDFRDMAIHANDRVDVAGGTFQTCAVERNVDGSCPGDQWIDLTYSGPTDETYPVSTADGSNCKTPDSGGGGTQCREGGVKTVNPAYDTRLFGAAGAAGNEDSGFSGGALHTSGTLYGTVNMLSTECLAADTLCFTGSTSYSASSIPAGVTRIIADGDIAITGNDGTLTGITLISTGGAVTFPSKYTLADSRVFSHVGMSFGKDFSATGAVTLASRGDIDFQGQSSAIQDGAVTFLVVSQNGSITVSGGPSGIVSGFFIAGNEIHYRGSPGGSFSGGLAAKQKLHFSGTARSPKFDSYLSISNPDAIEYQPPTLAQPVVSFIVLR